MQSYKTTSEPTIVSVQNRNKNYANGRVPV